MERRRKKEGAGCLHKVLRLKFEKQAPSAIQDISVFLIMLSRQNIHIIKEATKKLQPKQLGVFGSYARGEALPGSDLDILIDYGVQVDLLTLIGIEQELSEALGIKVDLITRNSVHERLLPYIEKDLISIL